MTNEDLAQARERLNIATRVGSAYQGHYAATAAGWVFVAIADALVHYLKAKTPEYNNPQDLR